MDRICGVCGIRGGKSSLVQMVFDPNVGYYYCTNCWSIKRNEKIAKSKPTPLPCNIIIMIDYMTHVKMDNVDEILYENDRVYITQDGLKQMFVLNNIVGIFKDGDENKIKYLLNLKGE